MTKPRAYLLPCGEKFCLERGAWSMTEPLTRLDSWMAFYKRLSARKNPRTGKSYSKVYGPNYAALSVLKRMVEK